MKRLMTILLACTIMCTFGACGKKEESSKVEIKESVSQKDGTYEEALREFFDSTYTKDSGAVCYSYMKLSAAIDALKTLGDYDVLVDSYNNNQNNYIDLMDNKPEITSIIEAVPLTDVQKNAAENYFVYDTVFHIPDFSKDDVEVTEAYEIKYNATGITGKETEELVCLAKIQDDGWKIIPADAETLEISYTDEALKKALDGLKAEK